MSKIITLAAAATGYVLGARAGRQRYEQISAQAQKLWQDPRVQKAAADARQTAAEKAPVVKEKVADAASKASERVTGSSSGSSSGSSTGTSTTPSTGTGTTPSTGTTAPSTGTAAGAPSGG